MVLTATVDITKTPITLTVVSGKRVVNVTVASAGETAVGTARFPITLTDTSGRVWTVVSDDGATAVYSG